MVRQKEPANLSCYSQAHGPQGMAFGIFLAPFHRLGENPTLALSRDMELIGVA